MGANKGNNTGFLAAFRNISNVLQGPRAALFYGGTGVLPFISIPVYLNVTEKYIPQLLHANITYGAAILGFLGAVRWGLAIPTSKDKTLKPTYETLGWAVTPASLGWVALLMSKAHGSLLIVGCFLMCILQDAYSTAYPPWYKSFRIIFSSFAVVSLSVNCFLFWSSLD